MMCASVNAHHTTHNSYSSSFSNPRIDFLILPSYAPSSQTPLCRTCISLSLSFSFSATASNTHDFPHATPSILCAHCSCSVAPWQHVTVLGTSCSVAAHSFSCYPSTNEQPVHKTRVEQLFFFLFTQCHSA